MKFCVILGGRGYVSKPRLLPALFLCHPLIVGTCVGLSVSYIPQRLVIPSLLMRYLVSYLLRLF